MLDAGALILYFPSPKTVTGEDVLELHIHGGPAIIKAVLGAIGRVKTRNAETIRYAEPGEFTHRAFLNDRVDLPQIEALGETLSADTEQQRRLAVRGASDALSKRYEQWRQQLLYARGELEAMIDFSEDQHFDESSEELVASVAAQVHILQRQIRLHIQNAAKGELLRNGIKVALLGAPNAGKSSLLNLIVGREAAIVSTEEGTTRDIVDVGVDLGGWYCKLGDMAGIRSEESSGIGGRLGDGLAKATVDNRSVVTIGAVEKEGIRRAKSRALESEVVLVVLSLERKDDRVAAVADDSSSVLPSRLSVEKEVLEATNDCARAGKHLLVVINKSDLLPSSMEVENGAGHIPSELADEVEKLFPSVPRERVFAISCREAQQQDMSVSISAARQQVDPGSIQLFLRGLISSFKEIASPSGTRNDTEGEDADVNDHSSDYWEDSLGVTHRQSSNLQRCQEHLEDFLMQAATNNIGIQNVSDHVASAENAHEEGPEAETDIVMAAEHLRFAADALAKITGKGESGDVEDVLGVVFEKYALSLFLPFLPFPSFHFFPHRRLDWTELTRNRFCVGK